MADNLRLQVILEAIDKATGPINAIVRSSKGLQRAFEDSAESLRKLKKTASDIGAFRRQEAALGDTNSDLQQAKRRLDQLAGAYQAAENPTAKMTRELRSQGNEVRQLTERQQRQRQELAATAGKLREAGIDTNRLAVHEKRLGDEIAQVNEKLRLQQQRMQRVGEAAERARRMHSGGMVAAAHGAGLAYGGIRALQAGAGMMQPGLEMEARMRDIGITGGLNRSQESALSAQVRSDAMTFGQTTEMISEGLGTLVANGITAQQDLARYSGLLAQSSVASGAEVGDLSNLIVSLQRNLGLTSAQVSGALDSMAFAGKEGSFELRDMAKWMPVLAPMMASLGVTGREAVDQLGAALQVARLGAGSSDEAANNLSNFLGKVTAPDTLNSFKAAGIDLKRRLLELQAQGINPLQGSLQIITEYMGRKGPNAMRALRSAMAIKDDEQRKAALEQLSSAYALGELFRDRQAMAFIRPALMNATDMTRIQQGAAGASGTLARDYQNRDDTAGRNIERMKIALTELKLEAFELLSANLGEWADTLANGVKRVMTFAKEHPALVGAMVKFAAALALASVAIGGLLMTGGTAAMMLGNILNIATKLGGGALLGGIGGLAMPLLLIAGAGLLIWKYWQPIKAFFGGMWDGFLEGIKPMQPALDMLRDTLAELLAPIEANKSTLDGFATVGKVVGQIIGTNLTITITALALVVKGLSIAFQWLGTLIGNTIGFIVTELGHLWDLITGVFSGNWGQVTAALRGLWDNVNQFFGGLPAKFWQFGIDMVQGLLNGIWSKMGSFGKTLAEIGNGAINRLKSVLGINSPSRVFAQLGSYTMAGFTQGLLGGEGGAQAALGRIGAGLRRTGAGIAIGSTLAAGAASAASIDHRPPLAVGGRGGVGMSATYNITINASGAQNARDIATLVRQEIERIEHQRRARTRAELSDYD